MGNKQNCGCICCKASDDKINQKEKLYNTEVIPSLSVHGLHYKKIKEKVYEGNLKNVVDHYSLGESPQMLSSIKPKNKEDTSSITNFKKYPGNIFIDNTSDTTKKYGTIFQKRSKFINQSDSQNVRKKLVFSPDKISYYDILSKAASLKNYDGSSQYSSQVIKSFSNYHFISQNPTSRFQNNLKSLEKIECEFIIYDQPLLKVTEGFQLNYIPRYCRITDKSFQYFKNEMNAFKVSCNPLMTIPFSLIDKVRIINFKPPIDKTHYFFEVLSYEIQKMNTKIVAPSFINEEEKPNKVTLHKKMNKSVDFSLSRRSYNINPSHLMREVLPGFNQEELFTERSLSAKHIVYKGVHFKTKEELTNFLLFKKEKTANYLNPFTLDLMKQRKVNNSLKYDYNWTFREIDWYLREKHFIFAVDNVKDLKKWVSLLNWIISKEKTQ